VSDGFPLQVAPAFADVISVMKTDARILALSLAAWLAPAAAAALPTGGVWISEVMYNPSGGDNGREWVELYNSTGADIDLAGYSLGWGGADYTTGVLQLSGILAAGGYFVVGGPTSDANNANPTYDLVANFTPDLQNPLLVSDGIALFDVPAASISATTVPIHALIFGGLFNLNGLLDEQGNPGAIDVGIAPAGESLEFDGAGWSAQASPSPGSGGLVAPLPEPGAAGLLLVAAAVLRRRVRAAVTR
jgi:hypothetical protein